VSAALLRNCYLLILSFGVERHHNVQTLPGKIFALDGIKLFCNILINKIVNKVSTLEYKTNKNKQHLSMDLTNKHKQQFTRLLKVHAYGISFH